MLQVLNSDASPAAAAAVMNRLAKLSARFIGDRGFSIGIDDVMPAASLQASCKYTEPETKVQADQGSGWQGCIR